jgi:hypothetical protein
VWQNTVWAALNTLNRMAKPGERIYLGTYWSLQIRPDLLQCALRGHEVAVLNGTVSDPARFIGTLRAYGVRYVVQDTLTHEDFVPPWNELRQALSGEGISRRTFGPEERMVIYYPLALHQQQCFVELGYKAGDFPKSEKAAAETLALPVYPKLDQVQQEYVVEQISSFYAV